MIPFNAPFASGKEKQYVDELVKSGEISGNRKYTKLSIEAFNKRFGFTNSFFTNSCSSALDMAAILCGFSPGEEIIIPSFGYVTSASAFHARGARVIFANSEENAPHINIAHVKELITKNTKALLVMHYAGSACDMNAIMELVKLHDLILIEDCAQAINVKYGDRFLGAYGHFSTFSFHETKNIHCGEGGMLVVNDASKIDQAHIVWQEGTNRFDFNKGIVDKYEWVGPGSSYQPSDLSAAFFYGQLEALEEISAMRLSIWNHYYKSLASLEEAGKIIIPNPSKGHNGHIFYFKVTNGSIRTELLAYLTENGVTATFHYFPLHLSPYWLKTHEKLALDNAESWSDCIVRLPIYNHLPKQAQEKIIRLVLAFFE